MRLRLRLRLRRTQRWLLLLLQCIIIIRLVLLVVLLAQQPRRRCIAVTPMLLLLMLPQLEVEWERWGLRLPQLLEWRPLRWRVLLELQLGLLELELLVLVLVWQEVQHRPQAFASPLRPSWAGSGVRPLPLPGGIRSVLSSVRGG